MNNGRANQALNHNDLKVKNTGEGPSLPLVLSDYLQPLAERSSHSPASKDAQMSADVASTQHSSVKPMSSSSTASSSKSPASSTRGGSSLDSGKYHNALERRRSTIERAMDKAKSKLGRRPSGAEALADDEADFERRKAKEVEKQRRKEEYERLGLGERTKFGMPGVGGWNSS